MKLVANMLLAANTPCK